MGSTRCDGFVGDAMHAAALREYPTREYARSHGVVAGLHLVKEED
jgi:hypothetical protein